MTLGVFGVPGLLLSKRLFLHLDKAIRIDGNFRTSEAGKKLTESLITYFKQTAPDETQSRIVVSLMNYFLGEEIGAYLGLAQSKLDQQVAKALYIFNNHPASPGANRSGYTQAKKTFDSRFRYIFQINRSIFNFLSINKTRL